MEKALLSRWGFKLRIIVVLLHSGEEGQGLSWDERLQIALDISHGIEYLHEGVYRLI